MIIEELKEIDPVLLELLAGLGIYGAAAGAAGMVTSGGSLYFLAGILAGLFFAVCLILNMYLTIDTALDLDPESANKYMVRRTLVRKFLTVLAAAVGIKIHMLTFSGIILGVLGIKIAAYLQPLIHRRVSEKRSGRNEEVKSRMD